MNYYVFNSKEQVDNANAVISHNMGFSGHITTGWCEPKQIDDGRYIIPIPDSGLEYEYEIINI